MGITVLDLDLISTDNINKCRQMCTEAEIILTVREVKSNINSLIALNLLEEQLLISDLYTLIAACSEGRVSAVYPTKLYDVLIERNILALHILKVEAGTEIVVGVVFLSALDAVFASIVDRWDTGHGVHESVYQRQMCMVVEIACQTVDIVVVHKVIQVDIAVYTAVSA